MSFACSVKKGLTLLLWGAVALALEKGIVFFVLVGSFWGESMFFSGAFTYHSDRNVNRLRRFAAVWRDTRRFSLQHC